MAITQTITALPTPPDPSTDSSAAYSSKAQAFTVAEVVMVTEQNTLATQMNTLAAAMNAAATGGAISIGYTFDSTTTDADPGAGKLRLSSATQNLSTVVRMDLLDNAGTDWTSALDLMDDSTSTIKGYLRIGKVSDGTKYLIFAITSAASPSGYRNITGTMAASSAASPFTNGDSLEIEFTRTGDKGDTGAAGSVDATTLAAAIHAATGKTTPVDADEFVLADSAAAYGLKKVTLANLKLVVGSVPTSCVQVHTGNGYGSTNNKIRRYTTALVNTGSDITYADSAANGASFTINTTGIYAIDSNEISVNTGLFAVGASVNSAQLTTSINSITVANRLFFGFSGGGVFPAAGGAVRFLAAGDVVRPHQDGNNSDTTDKVTFSIRRIA